MSFLKLLGDTSVNRILVFLSQNTKQDFSIKEISKYSKVGYTTTKLVKKKLVKYGVIKQTRKIGKAKMYLINEKSEIVQKFRELNKAIKKVEK